MVPAGHSFALIDGNTFYASCERVFRPDLRRAPVAVLSNNDGCVVTRSRELRALGVKNGTPAFRLASLFAAEDVAVFSSNYELYHSLSERMFAAVASLVPSIEVYSIDECFADMSGIGGQTLLGREIRSRVMQWAGIPTCVGIAPTKTLAKLCNHIAKEDESLGGVLNWGDLDEPARRRALALVPAGEVWGIGRQTAKALAAMDVESALDFAMLETGLVRRRFGVAGERMHKELRGIECLPLSPLAQPAQQVCRSRTFASEVEDADGIISAVSVHAADACRRLRRSGSLAGRLAVFFSTNSFRASAPQKSVWEETSFTEPTDDTLLITDAAVRLVRRGFVSGFGWKHAGVVLSAIVRPGESVQSSLMFPGQADPEKSKRLMEAMDGLCRRYGRDVLVTASSRLSDGWKMSRGSLSPCYTTRIAEVPEVS